MRRKMTLALQLSCVALAGCGVKTGASPAAAAAAQLSKAQRSQEQDRVMQAIHGMTPDQRVAYFKANPDDAALLAQ